MNGFDFSTASDIRLGGTTISAIYYGSNKIWPSIHDYSQDYLTFEALEACTFIWKDAGFHNSISYSIDDGSTWTTLTADSSTPTIAANSKVLFKGSNLTTGNKYTGIGWFGSSGRRFNVMGNIMSLIYGDNFANQIIINNNWQFSLLFSGCSIVDASNLILPATTLAEGCYFRMFQGCSALTTAPELLAPILQYACYGHMFEYCSSLNYIKCLATDISASSCTDDWVNDVSNNGTFVRAANNTSWTIGDSGIPTGWTVDPPLAHDYSQDYLTFEALEAGTFTWTDTGNNNSISYSIDDGSTWTTLASGSSTPTVNANSKVLFKASGLTVSTSSGIGTFSSSGRFDAMGNIMSLVYGDNFANQTTINSYQFYKLFKSNRIVDASNLILPATSLTPSCYREMFDSSELKITPKSLPATTLAENCYRSMFGNCTSLITVMSILPAMTLSSDCYRYMFGGSSLTAAPELPATTLEKNCYYQMFSKCASLTTAPELPATSLAPSCYYWMFNSCTSLTTAPELPATSLAPSCYNNMFRSCTLLNNVKCLATNISASNCTYSWLYSVATSGTFIKASTMSSWPTSPSGIPSGWTVVDAS